MGAWEPIHALARRGKGGRDSAPRRSTTAGPAVDAPRRRRPILRVVVVLGLIGATGLGSLGCPDPVGDRLKAPRETQQTSGAVLDDDRSDTRFVQIRELLAKGSDDPRRSTQLYSLVHPICVDPSERDTFMETVKWSASFSDELNQLTVTLALDTIEYVVLTCFRSEREAAYDLLDRADHAIPEQHQVAAVRARLLATDGKLEEALAAAQRASKLGSIQALALTANIQARIARSQAPPGYRVGMLDEAIQTVSVEPKANWRAIDVAAILSTRARLLWERATWEDPKTARATIAEADAVFERLSVPPFLVQMRMRALDNLCFDAVVTGGDPEPCHRAAEKMQILGAAAVAGLAPDPDRFDEERRARIRQARERWKALPKRAVVLLIVRGDEAEILEWTRPAARLLKALVRPDLRLVVVDRAREPRASALVDRLVALAGVSPVEVIRVGRQPLAVACISAIVDQRVVPKSCPLDEATVRRLEPLKPYGTTLLVGRDLDAELDDLAVYELDATLLSFRVSRRNKPTHAWLKSVSDTFLMAP